MVPLPPFLGPGFRLGARWNRLGQAVKTRKKREKTGQKWARYGLRSVNKEGTGGITCGAHPALDRDAIVAVVAVEPVDVDVRGAVDVEPVRVPAVDRR